MHDEGICCFIGVAVIGHITILLRAKAVGKTSADSAPRTELYILWFVMHSAYSAF